jgi:proline dehydrogenase
MSLLNSLIVKTLPLVPKSIVGRVSRRYIAGTTVADATRVIQSLNAKGLMTTLDLLGEDVFLREEAVAMKNGCERLFDHIRKEHLDANVSVKPSQLGLRIGKDFCLENIRAIARQAREHGNFVRIDMEDSTTTTDTLNIYRTLRGEGFDNVGVVIQAYMRRSEEDVRELVKMKANFRLCKGIYIEHPSIAFRDREEVRENFIRLLSIMMEAGCYVGIATHDDHLVRMSYELISRHKLRRDQYEFQMLLGVREGLRDRILSDGHRLRVYVPFGERWYAYSVRRLKENPEMAGNILRSFLGLNGKS